MKATARRNESAQKAAARRTEQEDTRRREAEKRHAEGIARTSQPIVRYVHEVRTLPPPKPEILRVLYLTANPDMDLRTEVEVRDVQQAVRAATHRDLIEITYRPAATPEDLLDGLNDIRPHVVHLSSHAGAAAVVFDNASIDTPRVGRSPSICSPRRPGLPAIPLLCWCSMAATPWTGPRCFWSPRL